MLLLGPRGALWLPFFFLLQVFSVSSWAAETFDDAYRETTQLQLAQDPTWLALLHFANGKCYIHDRSFYLSAKECSPQDEILELLTALLNADQTRARDAACRFPARIAFLQEKLKARGISLPTPQCAALEEYKSRAPAESISLVFAAENITSPMSMMGHVFMKFEGKTPSGAPVEHAASFFTNIDTLNIPTLLLDSLLMGMPSTFALVPYEEQLRNYQTIEGRSIFEYPLHASELQKKLIHMHVWELRTIQTPYLFVGYNCATVVYFLVALADPTLLLELGYWISPIDVVRKVHDKGITTSRRFIPSLNWQVRFYGQQLGRTTADSIIQALRNGSSNEMQGLASADNADLKLAFSQAVLLKERHSQRLLHSRIEELSSAINKLADPTVEFEVENLKDPTEGPRSSRVTFGATHFQGKPYGKIELLPASHSLSDDNRRSNSESTLELGQLSLLINPEGALPKIERATAYGIDSLVPHDPYVGGTSSRLVVGVERQWDGSLAPFTAGHLTGGIGKTLPLGEDARIYGLLNGSLNYGDGRLNPAVFPEVGGILYEVLSMKTVAQYRFVCGQHGSESCYQTTRVTQALLLNDSLSPYAAFETFWNGADSTQIYEVGLKLYM